ncbi:hypothetical protein MA16_Dca006517 [Dendrobium catenatum]|uniref:Uncharacterized protein n=1 Tax=Dendrobium catenatum TaxID=906689 RepID=A0A2I0XGS0_9ASPA|nr:hypothetical protein MA16_Dca006517 [Dendrobium catenatum]
MKPKHLGCGCRKGPVFGFGGQFRYSSLFLGEPRNKSVAKKGAEAGGGLSVEVIRCPICVCVRPELEIADGDGNVIVQIAFDVSKDSFEILKISGGGGMHKLTYPVGGIRYIRPTNQKVLERTC